ncbi:uncharacterized protein F5147DRAFT_635140 [Suillus discolor]|uniref:DUF7702 domain-containing protein n=1 Tax=Suillus discolor TaxID=1912936 RepID=A0A9P7JUH5_9AGAM|nr:uncharacterized protein F5147DRAFT_635140 [Suillus discolor]KAG2109718.1 hypothetical protein F5147DRAFT_635140 [Suillus discolor]
MTQSWILAIVTVVTYFPLVLVSFKLVAKYSISRGDGWVLLLVFSIIRVLGGVLCFTAAYVTNTSSDKLQSGSYALQSSGLSPLLLCTLGLLHSILQTPDGFSRYYNRQFRLLQLLGMAAFVLTIIGISSVSISNLNLYRMCMAGVILFCILYIILVGICLYIWTQIRFVMRYHKRLLKAVSITLPFLAVRTLYSVLSTASWANQEQFDITSDECQWEIYLAMDMLMEYAVVIIYAVAGFVLPLNEDYKSADSYQDEYPLSRPQM